MFQCKNPYNFQPSKTEESKQVIKKKFNYNIFDKSKKDNKSSNSIG